jgi:heme a synthase
MFRQTRLGPQLSGHLICTNKSPYRPIFASSLAQRVNFFSMASFLPGLRRAAPRLANDFFICHHCKKYARPAARQIKIPGKANLSRTIRFNSSAPTFPELVPKKTSPLSSLSQTISNVEKERANGGAKKGFFPETSSNAVAYWLLASAGSVFGIVVFGGLTRLTESG